MEKNIPPSWVSNPELCLKDARYKRLSRQRRKLNSIYTLWKRECQNIHPTQFHSQMHFSAANIKNLQLTDVLEGHTGCVNCLEFNEDGSYLISGSDDYTINLWDVHRQRRVKSYKTSHLGNIFSVKYVPQSNGSRVISGAADRLVEVRDMVMDEVIYTCRCHAERIKRIAPLPNEPNIFFSAAEDGTVLQFDLRTKHTCSHMPKNALVNLRYHCGRSAEVKCIDVNPLRNEYLAIGSNDPYVRVYDRRLIDLTSVQLLSGFSIEALLNDPLANHKPTPDNLPRGCVQYYVAGYIPDRWRRSSRVLATTYVSYSPDGEYLLSNLGGDNIHLFHTGDSQPAKTFSKPPEVLNQEPSGLHENSVEKENGRISTEPQVTPDELDWLFHYAKSHGLGAPPPEEKHYDTIEFYNNLIALQNNSGALYAARCSAKVSREWTGDAYSGLLDIEKALSYDPQNIDYVNLKCDCLKLLNRNEEAKQCMEDFLKNQRSNGSYSSRWDQETKNKSRKSTTGEQKEDGKNRDSALSEQEKYWRSQARDYSQFYHGHCNTTTDIKECIFMGRDGRYIAAGSDDGRFFIWDRHTTNLVRAIRADTTIVNCVQSHPKTCLLATSGIDSSVKLWTPLQRAEMELEDFEEISRKNQVLMRKLPIELMIMPTNNFPVGFDFPEISDDDIEENDLSCRTS